MLLTGLAMGSGMLSSAKTSRALAHLASVSWKGLSDPHSAEKLRHELTWVLPSLDFDWACSGLSLRDRYYKGHSKLLAALPLGVQRIDRSTGRIFQGLPHNVRPRDLSNAGDRTREGCRKGL